MVVTTHQAKTQLSKLIQRALAGEEIIIAKRDKPLVRLEPIKQVKPKREFGTLKDLGFSLPDDFDDEIDDFAEYCPTDEEMFVLKEEAAKYDAKKKK